MRCAAAKAAREAAEKRAGDLERKRQELEANKEDILNATREEADNLRQRLESEIRESFEAKRAAWQEHLIAERDAFVVSLRRQAGKQVLDITERVLADYADSDTAERVVATFTQRLKELDTETRDKMAKAASVGHQSALVHTGSVLSGSARSRITRVIHEALSTDIDVDYREDSDMVFGVRLSIGHYTVEWSATRYLQRLETELDEIIDAATRVTGDGRGALADHDTIRSEDEAPRDSQANDYQMA